MSNPWSAEIWRIIGLLFGGLMLGLAIGNVFLVLFIMAAGYIVWHARQLRRLEAWLVHSKKMQPPEGFGVWEEVFHRLYLLQQRNRSRKKRLANYLARFQSLTKALPDATVVIASNGEIEWFNDAAERFLNLRSPQDVGQRIDNLIRYPEFVQYLLGQREQESVVFPSPVHEGHMLSGRVVDYGQEQHLLVVRDVTRIMRLERMRRDFVANVSHELRTPLTVLNGYLETMVDADAAALKPWSRSLELMYEQGLHMNNIVEDLLLLSRLDIESSEPTDELVDVPRMLSMLCDEARALSGERAHQIELEVDSGLWLAGHATHLRSAFTNLVSNAVRYTPSGSHIVMRWGIDGNIARFEVQDSGEGIAAVHIPRLTERFYRVDTGRSRQNGGTGLGLAIVKHVVERHGGQLLIESTLGVGSVFRCEFPLVRTRRL